jgi:hypothetical protein
MSAEFFRPSFQMPPGIPFQRRIFVLASMHQVPLPVPRCSVPISSSFFVAPFRFPLLARVAWHQYRGRKCLIAFDSILWGHLTSRLSPPSAACLMFWIFYDVRDAAVSAVQQKKTS